MLLVDLREKLMKNRNKNNHNNNNKTEFKKFYPMSDGNTSIVQLSA